MNTVQTISNTELNNSKQQYKPLTEEQKLFKRIEGHLTVFEMVLQKVLEDGGKQNAINNQIN